MRKNCNEGPQIAPLDEHEWNEDSNIKAIDLCGSDKDIQITTVFHGIDLEIYINNEDLEAIVIAKGYDLVKRQSGGLKDERIQVLINMHTSLSKKNVTEATRKWAIEEIEKLLKADHIVPMS